jgi:hypothetical protein
MLNVVMMSVVAPLQLMIYYVATTFSVMTLSITTPNIKTLSINTRSIVILSIKGLIATLG